MENILNNNTDWGTESAKINQNFNELGSQMRVFGTKTEMESIAGSVNYKYVVLSDPTSSNNGYYHWNGSSYTKDASLSNGVISDSDPDPVSGGTVYDYLDDFTYLNISSLNGNYAYADLAEALAAVPQERRRPLCLISFRDSTSKPYFYYFLSSINQADNSVWNNIANWRQILDINWWNSNDYETKIISGQYTSDRDSFKTAGVYVKKDDFAGLLLVQDYTTGVRQIEIIGDGIKMYLRTRTYTVATDTWSEWVDTYDSLIDIINDITAFPKGIVSYDASENEFKIYLRRAETDKYDGFTLALTSDTSEIKYSHQWRLVGGGLYSYDPDTEVFSLLLTSMTSSENEFAMKFTGKYDYTGGLHGDERIDIDPSSYVKFFIDNKCLTASDLASDFVVECSSFSYIQYSTLHETTEDGVTPIAGHPIVGYHVKRNEFSNSGFFLENTFIANGSHNIDQFHSGLYCMGKDFAQYAFLPNAVLSPELTGTDSQIYADNMNASKIRYWSEVNEVGATIDSHFVEGLDDVADTMQVWDRVDDSKYYRRKVSMNYATTDGEVIRTTQEVRYY